MPLRFDGYYPYEQLVEALKALNAAHPNLTTLDLVGKSEEGREIRAMTVNNPKTGQSPSKPGVYVDGNIHGNEIQAAEVCLYLLNSLLTQYGRNEQITKLVDRNAFYVLPSVNVDGRYHFFKDANNPSSGRSIRVPRDDDCDGLVDEDFPDDLDGAYSFVGELFQTETETYRKAGAKPPAEGEEQMGLGANPDQERERLKFSDSVTQGELYKPWKAFKHPVYGDIEIDGWVKMSSRLPHPFMLQDLVHRNASAVMFAAGQTPQIWMEVCSTEKVGADLYKVRVRLVNAGGIPTRTFQTGQKRTTALDTLVVSGRSARVVAGGRLTDPYRDQVEFKGKKPEVQMVQVPGYGKVEYQYLISGKGDVAFTFNGVKSGTVTKTTILQ